MRRSTQKTGASQTGSSQATGTAHTASVHGTSRGFSLRTLLTVLLSCCVLSAALVAHSLPIVLEHLALVLCFAIPGACYGYDLGRTSRHAATGAGVASIVGTLLVVAIVLVFDQIAT